MFFQDKNLICSDCSKSFVFNATEQKLFQSCGISAEPKRCYLCREKYSRQEREVSVSSPTNSEPEVPAEKIDDVGGFEQFGLNPKILTGIKLSGYTTPTPIQLKAIPPVLEGRDVIALAQTGTGKTAAFVLPMLQKLGSHKIGHVRGLVVSPTRELAEQTNEAIASLGRSTGIRSISLYGGVGMSQQIRNIRGGIDIAVACPGRLLDHVWQGSIDLSCVEMLVIDEADRMFDMGFLPDITNILRCLPQKKQIMLFSATMPADVRKLVQEYLSDPVSVQIGIVAPASSVAHFFYPVKQSQKSDLLLEILRREETNSVVIFTRTKYRAERLAETIKQEGMKVATLQGNMPQARRQAAIDSFRRGKSKVLVATDIASRGIDVMRISHVINYDMPDTVDAYIHRIGRTGRVDKTGEAYTFVSSDDYEMVNAIEKALGKKVERRILESFSYIAEPPKTETSHKRPIGRQNTRAPFRSRDGNKFSSFGHTKFRPTSRPKPV